MSEHYRTVAIMAGGQSRRMGEDKAMLSWNGEPLLQHVAATALGVADRVLIIGRARPEEWLLDGVEFLSDETPDLGPIGGLRTALRTARRERISSLMMLACDMPMLDKSALLWLFSAAENRELQNGLICTRESGSQLEPLFSVYSTLCFPLVEKQIERGQRSLRRLVENGGFEMLEAPENVVLQLANVNTPADWRYLTSQDAAR